MKAGYGRGYYGQEQLAKPPARRGSGWIKWALAVGVVGAGTVIWLMWPRKPDEEASAEADDDPRARSLPPGQLVPSSSQRALSAPPLASPCFFPGAEARGPSHSAEARGFPHNVEARGLAHGAEARGFSHGGEVRGFSHGGEARGSPRRSPTTPRRVASPMGARRAVSPTAPCLSRLMKMRWSQAHDSFRPRVPRSCWPPILRTSHLE